MHWSPRPARHGRYFAALAEAGVGHVYATLPYAVRDCSDLLDVAADIHAQVRAAGL
ncbi:hypothetical protein [Streptomyces brasiliensis]|uniref:Uncharacterized protein n=1 Tax=Streptomyces brasiliensis TaxID=1954 RepID=A0A917LDV2_9ACTN|nr:hypothetical protein [Streptomyces brasiliensis]GGJ59197.1 hypothetical protein GCM10010121_082400 [Streptomyces brasiliensis]